MMMIVRSAAVGFPIRAMIWSGANAAVASAIAAHALNRSARSP
jgi:hypothetical protein